MRRTILETEAADDSSAAEDTDDKTSKKYIDFGSIQLAIQYTDSKLLIKVIGANNLINTDHGGSNDKSDAYVQLMLIPDKKKRSKRKTKVIKNSLDPKWDEQFEMSDFTLDELKEKFLEVVVKNDHFIISREKTFMGKCLIPLDSISADETTNWYKLHCKHFYEEQIKKGSE